MRNGECECVWCIYVGTCMFWKSSSGLKVRTVARYHTTHELTSILRPNGRRKRRYDGFGGAALVGNGSYGDDRMGQRWDMVGGGQSVWAPSFFDCIRDLLLNAEILLVGFLFMCIAHQGMHDAVRSGWHWLTFNVVQDSTFAQASEVMYVLEEKRFSTSIVVQRRFRPLSTLSDVLRKDNNPRAEEQLQVILGRVYFWKRDKVDGRRPIFQPQIAILDEEDAYLFPKVFTLSHPGPALYCS